MLSLKRKMQESLEETERSRTRYTPSMGKREKEGKKKTERKQEREIHSTS
jgi:hypothetical protein